MSESVVRRSFQLYARVTYTHTHTPNNPTRTRTKTQVESHVNGTARSSPEWNGHHPTHTRTPSVTDVENTTAPKPDQTKKEVDKRSKSANKKNHSNNNKNFEWKRHVVWIYSGWKGMADQCCLRAWSCICSQDAGPSLVEYIYICSVARITFDCEQFLKIKYRSVLVICFRNK